MSRTLVALLLTQKNLLVQDPLQRVPLPVGESTLHSSLDNVAFSFAPSDTDRVIVVDLGRSRRVREVGVELSPVAGVAFADAVGRYVHGEGVVRDGAITLVELFQAQ